MSEDPIITSTVAGAKVPDGAPHAVPVVSEEAVRSAVAGAVAPSDVSAEEETAQEGETHSAAEEQEESHPFADAVSHAMDAVTHAVVGDYEHVMPDQLHSSVAGAIAPGVSAIVGGSAGIVSEAVKASYAASNQAVRSTIAGAAVPSGAKREDESDEPASAEEPAPIDESHLPKGLQGLVVLELGDYVAMPACPRQLGELGATVYKIEPLGGNMHRLDGPGFGMPELGPDNPAFDMSNANKRFLSIDTRSEGGSELMDKLFAQADVFVTSLRNPSLRHLGFDYETLHKKYPKLVFAQMRGWGHRGPMRDAKGFDATSYSSRGGLLMSIPQAGEHFQPGNMPAAFGDFNASVALGMGIMAALWRAERTGVGDKVTVDLHHMALWGMQVPVVSHPFGAPYPKDRREAPCPTNNSYQTKDGVWFLICYGSYDAWYPFVMRLVGREDLADDPRYTNCAHINENGDVRKVIQFIADAFAQQDWDYWEKLFLENDVPYSRCFTMDDVLSDEEAFANDILRPIHYDSVGDHCITTTPVRMNSLGDPVIHRAKPIGYDTAAVMRELGYTDDDVQRFVENKYVRVYDGEVPPSLDLPSYGPDGDPYADQ